MLPSEELAWAAGLLEGEGTITIGARKRDDTFRLICIIGNTDQQVLQFFHERWGGWLQPAYGLRLGRKPAWSWTVAGPRAAWFLEEIAPYFRTRRVQVKAALGLRFKALQSRDPKVYLAAGYKDALRAIYLEFRALNRRGVTKPAA